MLSVLKPGGRWLDAFGMPGIVSAPGFGSAWLAISRPAFSNRERMSLDVVPRNHRRAGDPMGGIQFTFYQLDRSRWRLGFPMNATDFTITEKHTRGVTDDD